MREEEQFAHEDAIDDMLREVTPSSYAPTRSLCFSVSFPLSLAFSPTSPSVSLYLISYEHLPVCFLGEALLHRYVYTYMYIYM